jgi:hypothetical protein
MTNRKGPKSSTANQPHFLLFFAFFWLTASGVFLFSAINSGDTFPICFSSLFVLIGLGLMIYALMTYYARFRMGKPEFYVSQTELRPGDALQFSFTHTFPRNIRINAMKMQLIFRETATYQRGTDTTTVTHDHVIKSYEEPGQEFRSGHMLSKAYDMDIPADAMHTLKVRRNALEWFIRFEADIPSMPNFVEEFKLVVLPETTS